MLLARLSRALRANVLTTFSNGTKTADRSPPPPSMTCVSPDPRLQAATDRPAPAVSHSDPERRVEPTLPRQGLVC
jgi:hypothetical protein